MASPNIVWITLDSVRADHTTMDGYKRDTTPRMAAVGDDGHTFDTCIAHSKSTQPSSGAILTGLAPTRNTLGIDGDVLPEQVTTIAERFSNTGYQTACLSRNSFVSSATGLNRGFDRFQWLASETIRQAGFKTLAKYLFNIRKHSAGLTRDTAKHASPFLMNEIAERWLLDLRSNESPFFFYLHYNEPHRPYYPPLSYIDEYADDIDMKPREAAEFALDVHYDLPSIIAGGCDLDDGEWAALKAMYDAEIAYTDEMVGKLVKYVRANTPEDTIVVITADHGELFGEYGLLSHKYVLTDAVTRVPLVVSGLEESLAVGRDSIVQHADVMTTLLGIAGGDAEGTVGVDLRSETREYAVSQRGPIEFPERYRDSPDFDTTRFHESALTSLRTDAFRYQQSVGWSELFELPEEQRDVSADYPDIADELSEKLESWLERYGQPIGRGQSGEFSDAVNRQLRDLGYMD